MAPQRLRPLAFRRSLAILHVIVWPVVALLAVALAIATIRYGRPALEHHRHAQALVRIARLERELGIGRDFAAEIAVAQRDYERRLAPQTEPAARLYAHCASCGRHVAINAGVCHGGGAACAKTLWRTRSS